MESRSSHVEQKAKDKVMNNDAISQLDIDLTHAGEKTVFSEQMLKLEKLRITPEKQLPKMEFLFHLFGKPCFPRRELVAITGKAKSGKTFVTSMLMACCFTKKVLAFERSHTESTESTEMKPLRVLWYDTEQSDESTQDILKNRVLRMINITTTNFTNNRALNDSQDLFNSCSEEKSVQSVVEKNFDVFNVRAVEWKERRSLLKEAVEQYEPDLVIVDGIRDLVNDINDGVLAQEVMEELLHLATQEKCCIVCVLHQNKSSEDHNLRGWIGTELMNKAFEVYACEKMMPQRIFKMEQTLTRKYDIEQTLFFEVDSQGLPQATTSPLPSDEGERKREDRMPPFNGDYIIHEEDGSWQFDVRRLFADAMHGKEEIGGMELRTEVCNLANIRSWKVYNQQLQQALDEKVIEKSKNNGRSVYRPAPF